MAAINTLKLYDGTKCAILGSMLELDDSKAQHERLAVFLDGIDCIILIGKEMSVLQKKLKKCEWFPDVAAAMETINKAFLEYDVSLVKGSHGVGLWEIFSSGQP